MGNRLNVDRRSRVQLSTQISRQLTWLIATGIVPTDSHLPVIAELADHLGVNGHTVRAAYQQLAADGLVSVRRGTRTKVLGYDRNRAWAGTDRHASFTIGVLVPTFSDYYAGFLEAVSRAAAVEGWLPVICQTQKYEPTIASNHLDQLFSRNVDGVIAIHFAKTNDEETVAVFESSAELRPFVFVDSGEVGAGSRITVDRETDGYEATTHLIAHGHRRIGYIGGSENSSIDVQLGLGYSRALTAAGLDLDESRVVHTSDYTLEDGAKAAARLLQQDEPPTALFCAGDVLALGAIGVVHDLGLNVPHDVAIMGYGEIPFAALAAPSLSTTRLPADQLGFEAIRTLRRAIDEGSTQPPVVVETALIPRMSCNCPPRPTQVRPARKEEQ